MIALNLNDLERHLGPRATVVADHTPPGATSPVCEEGDKVHLYAGIRHLDDIKTAMMLVPVLIPTKDGEFILAELPAEFLDIPEPYNSLWYQPRA
jgi:hypothetical protein